MCTWAGCERMHYLPTLLGLSPPVVILVVPFQLRKWTAPYQLVIPTFQKSRRHSFSETFQPSFWHDSFETLECGQWSGYRCLRLCWVDNRSDNLIIALMLTYARAIMMLSVLPLLIYSGLNVMSRLFSVSCIGVQPRMKLDDATDGSVYGYSRGFT